jgi:hypothetical protein
VLSATCQNSGFFQQESFQSLRVEIGNQAYVIISFLWPKHLRRQRLKKCGNSLPHLNGFSCHLVEKECTGKKTLSGDKHLEVERQSLTRRGKRGGTL